MDIQQIINVNIKKDMMASKTWLKLNKINHHNNVDIYGTISNSNNNKHNSHNQQFKIQTNQHHPHHLQNNHQNNNLTIKKSKSFTNIEQLFAAV